MDKPDRKEGSGPSGNFGSAARIEVDHHGKVMEINPVACKLLGVERDRALGEKLTEIESWESFGLDPALLLENIEKPKYFPIRERENSEDPDVINHMSAIVTPNLTHSGVPYGASIVFYDLSTEAIFRNTLQTVDYINSSVSGDVQLQELFERTLHMTCETVGAASAALHLHDPKNELLRLAAVCRLPPAIVSAIDYLKPSIDSVSESFSSEKPLIIEEPEKLDNTPEEVANAGFGSAVLSPVILSDGPGALFTLGFPPGMDIKEEGLTAIRSISSALARVLEQVNLEQEKEQALTNFQMAAETLSNFLDNFPEGVVVIKGREVIYSNSALSNIFGFTDISAIEGRDIIDLVNHDARDLVGALIDDHISRFEPPGRLETTMLKNDGTVFEAEVDFSLIVKEGGGPLFQVSIRDMTDRINYERRLAASERKYRTLVELARQGIVSVDPDGLITFANRKMAEITDMDEGKLIDSSLTDLAHPDWVPVVRELFMSGRTEPVEQTELKLKRNDGSTMDCLISAGPVLDENGNFQGTTLFVSDLTETMSLREQLYTAEKMTAVGRLAGGVAHEFNNIHAAIQGYIELLIREEHMTDSDVADLESVRQLIRRASHITQQLLVFASRETPRWEIANLADIVESNIRMVIREYESEGVEIRTSQLTAVPDFNMSPGRVGQVVMELIINAHDSIIQNDGEKIISIETAVIDDWARLTVRDTGQGIKEEDKKRVFEPFFTTKGALGGSTIPGTGLGLSVAHAIAREHGGEIVLSTPESGGAEFALWLPVKGRATTRTVRSSTFGPAVVGANLLIVDDEKDITNMLERAFTNSGYMVDTALRGKEAIHKLYDNRYDVMLLDLQMPDIPGEDVIIEANGMPFAKKPKIIVVTGKSGFSNELEGKKLGVDGVIKKPFYLETLFRKIYEVLAESEESMTGS